MTSEGNGRVKEPVKGYDKCPYCGSEKRIIRDEVIRLEENGTITKGLFPNKSGAWEMQFIDQKKFSLIQVNAPRLAPSIKILWDVCANPDCYALYIVGIEYGEKMVAQFNLGQMPGMMGTNIAKNLGNQK